MIGQRAKHLTHSEAVATRASKARFAVLHGNLKSTPSVGYVCIACALFKACQHADAAIGDDDFKGISRGGVDHEAGLGPLAVQKNIVLQLAHCSDDRGCQTAGKTDGDSRLLGAASPQCPKIRICVRRGNSRQREDAGAGLIAFPCYMPPTNRLVDDAGERCCKFHVRESRGIAATRQHHLDQRSHNSGAQHADAPHSRKRRGLRGPSQLIGDAIVADDLARHIRWLFHNELPRQNRLMDNSGGNLCPVGARWSRRHPPPHKIRAIRANSNPFAELSPCSFSV